MSSCTRVPSAASKIGHKVTEATIFNPDENYVGGFYDIFITFITRDNFLVTISRVFLFAVEDAVPCVLCCCCLVSGEFVVTVSSCHILERHRKSKYYQVQLLLNIETTMQS